MELNKDLKGEIWDEKNFEKMQWHDNKIYAVAFDEEKFELIFDIDYIVKWVDGTKFKFWVCQATLVFRNVYDLNISLYSLNVEIDEIQRNNPNKAKNANYIYEQIQYDWKVITQGGDIIFKSVGFKLFFRDSPSLIESQSIGLKERGGICFNQW